MTTTKTLDGAPGDEAGAKPPEEAKRRSETLTLAFLAGSLVLLLLAAIGRVPSKVGAGPASMEFSLPPEAAAQLAKEAAEKGITDPEKLKEAADRIQARARTDLARADPMTLWTRRRWPATTFGQTSPGDDYWSGLAKESLEEAVSDSDAAGHAGAGSENP